MKQRRKREKEAAKNATLGIEKFTVEVAGVFKKDLKRVMKEHGINNQQDVHQRRKRPANSSRQLFSRGRAYCAADTRPRSNVIAPHLGPLDQCLDRRPECMPDLGELVLHPGWHLRVHRAQHDAILF